MNWQQWTEKRLQKKFKRMEKKGQLGKDFVKESMLNTIRITKEVVNQDLPRKHLVNCLKLNAEYLEINTDNIDALTDEDIKTMLKDCITDLETYNENQA